MAKILYLVHRTPFPPDKGDKITTFNLLRHLGTKHQVYLGAFVDDPADWQHTKELQRHCAEVKLVGIDPRWRKLASARAVLGSASISEVYHRSGELQAWVDQTMAGQGIDAVLAYCSAMAPFAASPRWAGKPRVTHYADVDSQKWVAYAEKKSGPMAWVYGREARTLLHLEREMSKAYDVTSFVSDADAELYRTLAPESAAKVRVIPNGVDTDYFDPGIAFDPPFKPDERAIVFTGAMDYWPNVDAVVWFAKEVLPLVRAQLPAARFWIVGSKPAAEVQALAALDGVSVTGRVPDVRPYIAASAAVVAPLRVARGVQNKVLEAYAMARNVVLSPGASGGLRPEPFIQASVFDSAADTAAGVLKAIAAPPRFDAARDYVMRNYAWAAAFTELDRALRV
jgi:sugar transferase (PEP-CTERM/EpsH1 system associated)